MITDLETGWVEPTIIINGVELSFAEALAVRVAVSSFLLYAIGHGPDLGVALAGNYRQALERVESYMRQKEV